MTHPASIIATVQFDNAILLAEPHDFIFSVLVQLGGILFCHAPARFDPFLTDRIEVPNKEHRYGVFAFHDAHPNILYGYTVYEVYENAQIQIAV